MKNLTTNAGLREGGGGKATFRVNAGRGTFKLRTAKNVRVRQNLASGKVRFTRRKGETNFGAMRRLFQRGSVRGK